jgi:hypothetical protein
MDAYHTDKSYGARLYKFGICLSFFWPPLLPQSKLPSIWFHVWINARYSTAHIRKDWPPTPISSDFKDLSTLKVLNWIVLKGKRLFVGCCKDRSFVSKSHSLWYGSITSKEALEKVSASGKNPSSYSWYNAR